MVLRVDGNDLPTSSADQQDAIKAVHQDFQELHIWETLIKDTLYNRATHAGKFRYIHS